MTNFGSLISVVIVTCFGNAFFASYYFDKLVTASLKLIEHVDVCLVRYCAPNICRLSEKTFVFKVSRNIFLEM